MSTSEKRQVFVIKRDGRKELFNFEKVSSRIKKLCYGLNMNFIHPAMVIQLITDSLNNDVTTAEIDNLAAHSAATMTTKHPDYAVLAARIAISSLHKETKKSFSEVMSDLQHCIDAKTNRPANLISKKHYEIIQMNSERLNSAIIHSRDFIYNYSCFKNLEMNYLLKIGNRVVERPQHMLMRLAVGIHEDNVDQIIETYNFMSLRCFTHESPALFSACTKSQQMSSCSLLTMIGDDTEGICDTMKTCALISKSADGIGLNTHNISMQIAGINGE